MRIKGKFAFLVFAFLVLTALASVSEARTIYVPDDYEKIQWAVDNASDGDTIIVRDGIYYESITVSKQLTIKSENGPDNCIVNGGGSLWSDVFTLKADGIRIEGFTITGGWHGIYLECSNKSSISNNNISNNGDGIYLWDSNNNRISNNKISSNNYDGIDLRHSNNNCISNNIISSNNWHGIYLGGSNNSISNNKISSNNYDGIDLWGSNNSISNNEISSNNEDGIYLVYSSNNCILNNNISNNEDGIYLYDSNENSISGNIISSNRYGIYLNDSNENSISRNNISSNGYGIYLKCSNNNSISGNNISSNNWNGIYLYDSNENSISRNNISSNNWNGIYLKCSNNNSISGNNIPNNYDEGIYLVYSSNNCISNNNISDNDDGIVLDCSHENSISGNIISLNDDDGIHLWDSIKNSISGNIISSNRYGIYLYDSNENSISGNIISSNRYGIYLKNSYYNNVIYINNFIDNTYNAYSYYSINIWNSTEPIKYTYKGSTFTNYMGNYWSDYRGSDANGDGIGDIPYFIGSDRDEYPLIERFENYFLSFTPTIYVPDDYEKIQWAVDNASVGYTIIVRDGTYYENVVVNKKLTIKSENGSDNCIVDGGGIGDVITLNADGITIEGFTVRNSGSYWSDAGIKVFSNANNITYNSITNNYYGIYLSSSCNNTIVNNIICSNNWHGINLDYSKNNSISYNNISNNSCGIYLWYSNDNKIRKNEFIKDGLFVEDSYRNIVEDNEVNRKPLIYLEGESDKFIDDAGQIILVRCKNITIMNAEISNTDVGIELWESDNCLISNNNISNNWDGIFLLYSNKTNISNNNISSSKWYGIDLWCSNNNSISENKISLNKWNGMHLEDSNNNSISNNNIRSNNHDGIYLEGSNNSISYNNISNNSCGIYLWYSNNNIISNNDISSNMMDGILLTDSNNNIIYLNNFINNTYNAISHDSKNIWNSAEKITYTYKGKTFTNYLGNYWDDYTGSDTNGDGIGDTPYSIDSDKDYYPLMRPFEYYFVPDEPKVSVSTDKYEYGAGDLMLINITFENPTDERKSVKFLWTLDIPDYNLSFTVINNKSILLPPEFKKTFVIPWRLPKLSASFNASWYVALYSDGVISEDTADWRYVGRKGGGRDIAIAGYLREIERSGFLAALNQRDERAESI